VLTVLADPHDVRIVDGAEVLARHPRSYDRRAQIEVAAHIQTLVDDKHAARQHRATDRLAQAAPASQTLLMRAAERGAINLHGLLAHWSEVATEAWVATLLGWEEQERARRSLERRLRTARIGRFKPICDFDWSWPKRCDRVAVDALMTLEFIGDATNVVLVGPNGVGKSMLAQNHSPPGADRGSYRAVHQRRPTAR
jgi:DNA replication protein DnaC